MTWWQCKYGIQEHTESQQWDQVLRFCVQSSNKKLRDTGIFGINAILAACMSQKLVESIYQAAKILLVYALHCANKTMGLEFLILGSRLRSLGGSNAEFLILGTADMLSWAIHCCGDCLAPCEMFSTVAGLYPLEASCTLVLPLLRKHKCIQTWSNACGRQNCSWFGTKDPREARKMHI